MATKTQAYARAHPHRLKDLITGIKIAGPFLPGKNERERKGRQLADSRAVKLQCSRIARESIREREPALTFKDNSLLVTCSYFAPLFFFRASSRLRQQRRQRRKTTTFPLKDALSVPPSTSVSTNQLQIFLSLARSRISLALSSVCSFPFFRPFAFVPWHSSDRINLYFKLRDYRSRSRPPSLARRS